MGKTDDHVLALVVVVGVCLQPACGDAGRSDAAPMSAGVIVVDAQQQALVVSDIRWINGTYDADCDGRETNEPWSLVVGNVNPHMAPHERLLLLAGDASCTLVITEAVTAGPNNGPNVTYEAAGTLRLTEGSWSPAVGFRAQDPDTNDANDPVVFHASGRVNGIGGAGPTFAVTVRVSDEARVAPSGTVTAQPEP